jgi:hypothetical protein
VPGQRLFQYLERRRISAHGPAPCSRRWRCTRWRPTAAILRSATSWRPSKR